MPDLAARIDALRADIESFVDAKVAEIKKDCANLPLATIKNTLIRGNCECRSYLDLVK
jgi:hypothetical protein